MLNGQAIDLGQTIKVKGEVKVASVIIIHACVGADGQISVVSITVVFQLEALPPTPPPSDDNQPRDCKPGPGRGLGHCKDKHKDEHDED